MDIIHYLLQLIQYLYQQNCWLVNFICRYIPLKQWAFDDSHSPKYQKFKVDELPLVTDFRQDWTYKELIPYYGKRYGRKFRPVSRRSECDIPDGCSCPRCNVPKSFLYKNNGSKSQILCKVCAARFSPSESRFSCVKLRCLHSGNALVPKKDRKHFIVYKYVNPKCPYYLHNLNKVQLPDYGNLWRTENFLRMIPLAAKVLCPHRGSSLSGKPAGANDAGIRRVEREAYIIYTVRS